MKIIIAGVGKMGVALTRQLSAEGYDITLIDLNQKILEQAVNQYDVFAVQGNCASINVLKNANVQSADLLIAAARADELNLLCCMTAHQLNPNLHTIARIRNPEYSDQIYGIREIFGLSLAVNPERQGAVEIERLLRYPGFLRRDTFAKGRVEIVELRVDSHSILRGSTLSNLPHLVGCKVLVCAVLRNGRSITPDGSFTLMENDLIFVTAPTENLSILLKNLGIFTRKIKKVTICGGGPISHYLAQMLLNDNMQVTVIEKDPDRCVYLSDQLPDATILHGDASNLSLLESEGLDQSDAIISLTDLDELNMIISLHADNAGVPQVVTKLDHLESSQVLNMLPIGSTMNPIELSCNRIVRYVRAMKNQVGAAVTIHAIADGQAEAAEFRIDQTSKYCNTPLKKLKLRKGILIVCIKDEHGLNIPDGDSFYEEGSTVLVVLSRPHSISSFNEIFED